MNNRNPDIRSHPTFQWLPTLPKSLPWALTSSPTILPFIHSVPATLWNHDWKNISAKEPFKHVQEGRNWNILSLQHVSCPVPGNFMCHIIESSQSLREKALLYGHFTTKETKSYSRFLNLNRGKTLLERVHSGNFSFPRYLLCWLFCLLCLLPANFLCPVLGSWPLWTTLPRLPCPWASWR